jgi:hypothetical protein
VIAVGGIEGTQRAAQLAQQMGKPLYGLAGSGGVADVLASRRSPEGRGPAQPLDSYPDARRAVADVLDRLGEELEGTLDNRDDHPDDLRRA